jgi:hypothetical protein
VQSMKIAFAGPAKPSPRVGSGDAAAKGDALTARSRVERLFQRRSVERRMAALLGDCAWSGKQSAPGSVRSPARPTAGPQLTSCLGRGRWDWSRR